ncbi:MAG: hypothetical protein JXB45_03035, partial [Candidatus Krumholzibacteriota bacterium]|nr:hypothetical protein [Candidatus Krumholzibacteriota bacterium]
AARASSYRILSSGPGSVTVEFLPGVPELTQLGIKDGVALTKIDLPHYIPRRIEGRPVVPMQRFIFEVPAQRGIRLQVMEKDLAQAENFLPEVWFSAETPIEEHFRVLLESDQEEDAGYAVLAQVGIYRNRYLALVDIFPVNYDRESRALVYAKRLVVRLSFPPVYVSARPAAGKNVDDRYIVNAAQASTWAVRPGLKAPAQRTPYELSYSDKWIKLKVTDAGLYTVDYNDLLSVAVNPLDIDPATIRLYSTGPIQQRDSVGNGGSFEEDYHMLEHDIIYRGEGSGSFLPGESIIFYAAGIKGWSNTLDPRADDNYHYDHRYALEAVYWLTWEDGFPGPPPGRMDSRNVSPGPAPPDFEIDSYEERLHKEYDRAYDAIYTDDRWYWVKLGLYSTSFVDNFTLSDIAGGSGKIRMLGYGPYDNRSLHNRATGYINGLEAGQLHWTVVNGRFYPDTLEVSLTNLAEGSNIFKIDKPDSNIMYLLWYEIYYDRYLRAQGGRLDFFTPPTPGRARFEMSNFTSPDPTLLDVTWYRNPVLLTGWQNEGGAIRFDDDLGTVPAHYVAVEDGALRKPGLEVASRMGGDLPSLRDETEAPQMVIIYHNRFEEAALTLRNFHSLNLPHAGQPVVKAVDIEDVYDNFSGGMKDPIAMRNYFKFLYDNFREGDDPVLRYVLLVGNGNYDPKNITRTGSDYVPLFINFHEMLRSALENDDFFTKLDPGEDALNDLAIGRMTVLTEREANHWANRIVRYQSDVDLGSWRNKIVLIADDELSHYPADYCFTVDCEEIAVGEGNLPNFLDLKKLYMHDYPFFGTQRVGIKEDIRDEWNEGALVVTYIGHGSPINLADESMMTISDIFALKCGPREPLFMAFSCTVANMDDPFKRSMGQEMVVNEGGGAIAVIAATDGTIGYYNRELGVSLFDYLFTSQDSTGTEPIGYALQLAKVKWNNPFVTNSASYALLGDPALRLAVPAYTVEYDVSGMDSMYTGHRYWVNGSMLVNGSVQTSFNGQAQVIVQESPRLVDEGIVVNCYGTSNEIKYYLPGREIFKGTVDVVEGRFGIDFVIPLRCRTGLNARVRSYLSSPGIDAVGSVDTLLLIPSASLPPNAGPPVIDMFFPGQATRVKEGAILHVSISDPDGIAILGSDPQSSIFLEFDQDGIPIYITEAFEYYPNSSASGEIKYSLEKKSPGPHTVMVRAYDNLGMAASDTLSFEVVEEGLFTVSDVFNLPNPFTESTNFIFQLSNDADVCLRVYNVSGVEIWRKNIVGREGFNSIYWRGRDFAGSRLANGTYLYILEVVFRDSFNRKEIVKGKVVLLQ